MLTFFFLCTQALEKMFVEDEYEHVVTEPFQFKAADVDPCIEILTWSVDQLRLTGDMSKLRVSGMKTMQKHYFLTYF